MNTYRDTIGKWLTEDSSIPNHRLWFILSLHLVAFVIPFGSIIVSYAIITCVLLFIVSAILSPPLKINLNTSLALLPALYFVYCYSLFYTTNKHAGYVELGLKFSLLLFPLLFSVAVSFIKINVERVLLTFTFGCLACGIVCLTAALLNFITDNNSQDFFYKKFSLFLHPGYYSMYLNLGIAFLGWNHLNKQKRINVPSPLFYAVIVLFALLIILLSSKIGFITLLLLLIIYILYFFTARKNVGIGWISGISIVATLLIILFVFVKNPFERFASLKQVADPEKIDVATNESTGVRLLIWKASLDIIKNNWLTGVGAGDAEDALKTRYNQLGMKGAEELNLNAHNQYLQTLIAVGLPGFLLLFCSTFVILLQTVFSGKYLAALFLIIIILNFSVESVLQTQAGVVFFSFFNSLLISGGVKNKT